MREEEKEPKNANQLHCLTTVSMLTSSSLLTQMNLQAGTKMNRWKRNLCVYIQAPAAEEGVGKISLWNSKPSLQVLRQKNNNVETFTDTYNILEADVPNITAIRRRLRFYPRLCVCTAWSGGTQASQQAPPLNAQEEWPKRYNTGSDKSLRQLCSRVPMSISVVCKMSKVVLHVVVVSFKIK